MNVTLAYAGLVAGLLHVLAGPDRLAPIATHAVRSNASPWESQVLMQRSHVALSHVHGRKALALETSS